MSTCGIQSVIVFENKAPTPTPPIPIFTRLDNSIRGRLARFIEWMFAFQLASSISAIFSKKASLQ